MLNFDSISGTSSKKAVVKNLRVQNVFVNAGYSKVRISSKR